MPKAISQLDITQRAIAQLRAHCSYTTQEHKTQHFFMSWAVPVSGRSVSHSPHPFVTQNANNPTDCLLWETDCSGSQHPPKPYWECNYKNFQFPWQPSANSLRQFQVWYKRLLWQWVFPNSDMNREQSFPVFIPQH